MRSMLKKVWQVVLEMGSSSAIKKKSYAEYVKSPAYAWISVTISWRLRDHYQRHRRIKLKLTHCT